VATPVATPSPDIIPTAAPSDLPAEPTGDDGRLTLRNTLAGLGDLVPAIAIGGAVLVVLGLLLWFFRRRRADDRYDEAEQDGRRVDRHERFELGHEMRAAPRPEPALPPAVSPLAEAPAEAPRSAGAEAVAPVPDRPVAASVTEIPAPAPVTARAALDIALHPRRAGTNLTSAAVEYDVVVRNAGGAAATQVRLDVRLLTAGAQQDVLINALFAEPVERPITPPFDLLPGTEVRLGGMGILPRERVTAMTVEGRELFVPVITVNLIYDWAGGSGQTARSFVIGIERGGAAKMGAFRLDDVRMFAEVGALEYIIAVDR
jgi:hypothetical protein